MKRIENEMKFFNSLVKGLAAHFGNKCEFVLHDYEKPYEATIVSIENGHVTGRSVGHCGTNTGLQALREKAKQGDRYNYFTQTKDGRILRSSTIYINNEKSEVIGSLCINLDITELKMAERAVQSIIDPENKPQVAEQTVFTNVNELLDSLIQESIKHVGIPVSHMTREQKIEGIEFLDRKGAFLIKKGGDRIAKFYDISKYTLYTYLDEERNGRTD